MKQRRWDGEAELTDWAELIKGVQEQDGNMLKEIMETTKSWIDRMTHLSDDADALRGFNEFAKDSGRKVKEKRK